MLFNAPTVWGKLWTCRCFNDPLIDKQVPKRRIVPMFGGDYTAKIEAK